MRARCRVALESSRLAQLVERKTLNLVVVGSSPTVGRREPMAQRQRVGFQTRRLGVQIPLGSYLFLFPLAGFCFHACNPLANALPPELRWQSGRLLTDRSLVRSQVVAHFYFLRFLFLFFHAVSFGPIIKICSSRKSVTATYATLTVFRRGQFRSN